MMVSQIIFFAAVALLIILLLRMASRGDSLGQLTQNIGGRIGPATRSVVGAIGGIFSGLGNRAKSLRLPSRPAKESVLQPSSLGERQAEDRKHDFWQSDFATEKHDLPSRFEEGEQYMRDGKLVETEQFFLRLAANHPNDPKIYARLGLLYLNQKNYSDAIESLKVAVKLDKYNPSRHYNLALAYFGNNDTQRSIAAVREAISLDPVTPKYRSLLEQLLNRE
ncbi:MAG TPA: tetratricopeptide repeat protein [Candidatus Saccharimonadales bacterium]|nr:tetratricopeptide repeat protein [Candidatus Saccharimonadales bacterium]